MFINPITAAIGAIKLFSEITSSHKKEDKAATADLSNNFNVNNMSLNDLTKMSQELMQQGELSEKDAHSFLSQIASIQQLSGISKDNKVDMVHLFEQQIQNLNSTSNTKAAASFQHSLDILNGVKARSGASIPQSV